MDNTQKAAMTIKLRNRINSQLRPAMTPGDHAYIMAEALIAFTVDFLSEIKSQPTETELSTSRRKAQQIVSNLCNRPDVWATHGCPSENKLRILEFEFENLRNEAITHCLLVIGSCEDAGHVHDNVNKLLSEPVETVLARFK